MAIEPRYRREHIVSPHTKTRTVCLFKMVQEIGNGNSVVKSHKCGPSCLSPLTFDCQAVGDKVHLSQGCRLAERVGDTFRHGLVFSSRQVKVQERIRLRVENDSFNWHGALRVGFTNVPPSARPLPLPDMAIPNLTEIPGHWAAPVHESYCQAGSELKFWVSHGGNIYVTSNNNRKHKLLTGVDLSQPLWFMIDIYGRTCSIFLQGSETRRRFCNKRSCPAPERLTPPDVDNHSHLIPDDCISDLHMEVPAGAGSVKECVVCLGREAQITLPCGHRCLCRFCAPRVLQQFDTCPLCRQSIRAPSVEGRCVSALLQDTRQE